MQLYRILALLLAAAPIVCLCLLKVKLLVSTSAGYAVYGEKTFLDAFLALFKKDGLAVSIRRSRALPPISGRINLWASPSSPRVRSASS